MAEYQAGWYPDPAGDPTKLRYWDGAQWTEHYAVSQEAAQTAAEQTAQPAEPTQPEVAQPTMPAQPETQPQPVQAEVIEPQQTTQGNYAQPIQPQQPYMPQGASDYSYSSQQQNQTYSQPAPTFEMSSTDKTLRLIAFIFCVIGTVVAAVAIFPLIWMIPMTIYAWKIYKGTRPNSIIFGVCTLLFVSMIGGILLLISKKEKQP